MTGGCIVRFLLVLLASAVFLLSHPNAVRLASAAPTIDGQVVVYYFHGSVRCERCLRTEALAEGTLRADFPRELASGALLWRTLDVNLPAHPHFVADFGLGTNELVVVWQPKGGEPSWGKIPELWDLAADPGRFIIASVKRSSGFLATESRRRADTRRRRHGAP